MTCPDCWEAWLRAAELEEEVKILQFKNEQLSLIARVLISKVGRLEKGLAESKKPDWVKLKRKKKNPKKTGRKMGHKGESRKAPDHVDEVEILKPLEKCPRCGREVSKPQDWRTRYKEEIILPQIHVTKYEIPRSYCPHCDKMVEPPPDGVLPNRRLGNKLRCYIVYLREELRLPVNVVRKHLADVGINVSEATVENVCSEMAEFLEPHYEVLKGELRESRATNNDETGKRIEGENCWEWVFAKSDTVVFHSDRRRSHDVMEDLYGKYPKPILGSDCYTAYNPLDAVKQRCWSHLLKGTSELESSEGRSLHESLKDLHTTAQYFDRGPPWAREIMARYFEGRLQDLVDRDWTDPDDRRIAKLVKKHRSEWFNFVRYPEVESTNNLAERVLRPEVVFRKIIGGHRSWNGARKHDVLRSTLATCKLRGQNYMGFLEKWLKEPVTS